MMIAICVIGVVSFTICIIGFLRDLRREKIEGSQILARTPGPSGRLGALGLDINCIERLACRHE